MPLSLVMVASFFDAAAGADEAAAARTPAVEDAGARRPLEAEDVASAKALARLNGRRVEVLAERTEYSTTWVEPDGAFTTEVHQGRIRFKDAHDEWRDVDLDLSPASTGQLSASGNGADLRLARRTSGRTGKAMTLLTRNGKQISLGWKGALPEPAVKGSEALYEDVEKGVDLKVEALRNGFEQFLVLKERPSVAPSWTIPLDGGGLVPQAADDGGVDFVDDKGQIGARIAPALAWDAEVDERSGEPKSLSPVALSVTKSSSGGWELVVTPDADWIMSEERVFPITVDPTYASVTVAPSLDTFVQNSIVNTPQSGATELKVGTYDGGTTKARTLMNFATASFVGKKITSAKLSVYTTHSYSCSTNRAVTVKETTALATTSTLWSNQPGTGSSTWSGSWAGGSDDSCGTPRQTIDVTTLVDAWSKVASTTKGIQLSASESDSYGWKKFASSETSNDPYLSVSYDRAPATPTAVGLVNPAPVSTWVRSKTPTLTATVTDPDGDLVNAQFEVWRGSTKVLGPVNGSSVSSGSASQYTIPTANALTEGESYTVKAKAIDSPGLTSAQASSAAYTVDTTPTDAPVVSSTDYPDDTSWTTGGTAGAFHFSMPSGSENAEVTSFQYLLDGGTIQTVAASTESKDATVTLTPADGRRLLSVQAIDRAGNVSATTAYRFSVGRGGLAQPQDGARTARRVRLALQVNDSTLTHARFEWRRGAGAAVAAVPDAVLSSPSLSAVATPVALSSIGGYLDWDAPVTLGAAGGVVDVRAILSTSATPGGSDYATPWTTVVVDPNAQGATAADIGPGSVNLQTGDYAVDTNDAEEFGLSVSRAASSRDPGLGWQPQGELLTSAQQDVTDITGFTATYATLTRDTTRGHDSSDSLKITAQDTTIDYVGTRANLGGDQGAMRLGMRAGHRYRISGWIYVPTATGLATNDSGGLTLQFWWKNSAGVYQNVKSPKPSAADLDGWRELEVETTIPEGATEAFVRVMLGFSTRSGKYAYFDDFSVRELLAPFGPQWDSGPDSDLSGDEYIALRFPTKTSAEIRTAGGGAIMFTRPSTSSLFSPEPGSEDLTLRADATVGRYRLTEADGTVTFFDRQGTSDQYLVSQISPPDVTGSTRYLYTVDTTNKTALPYRIVNPAEPGVSGCDLATPGRGCEALQYYYGTTTTNGDYPGRVSRVTAWSWNPTSSAMEETVVTRYTYDSAGRLTEVWDPRVTTPLKTTYTYDSAGRLATAQSPGEQPWTFTYGTVPGDSNGGRLVKVTQSQATVGGSTPPPLSTTIVYNVPLTRAAGGPYDVNASAVAAWGQGDVATDATAVFPPETEATVASATSSTPGADGYPTAVVHYFDASGREVNTASPGGYIDTSEFDRFGNVVRSLDSTSRMIALGQGTDAPRWLAELGLTGADTVTRSRALDSVTRYSSDGLDALESWGPARSAVTEDAAADPDGSGPLTALAAGTTVVARPHSTTTYDEGKPDDVRYHLPTTETEGAIVFGQPAYGDIDVRTVKTMYSPVIGGSSGWTLRQPTQTTVDPQSAQNPNGANLTTSVRYDSDGRAVESRKVDSAGGDARTTETVFYTAGTNGDATDGGRCGNRPEWAGQPCVTRFAGTVTGSSAPAELPTKYVQQYNASGDAVVVVDEANGQTRTTTTTYDAAGRVKTVTLVGTSAAGTSVDVVNSVYDDATGDLVDTYTTSGANETGRIHRVYDGNGRLQSYSDADGGVTTTTFDAQGRPSVVTSSDNGRGLGSTTFTYDRSKDPRGFLTSVTDSVAGTFSATYGPDGQVTSQTLPGGVVQKTRFDASGSPVARTYAKADGTLIYGDQVIESVHGQWMRHAYNGAARAYKYDRMGRLTQVTSTLSTGIPDGTTFPSGSAGPCTVRSYGYDNRANRTSKTVKTGTATAAGVCTTTTTATETHAYDAADRLVDAGYTYDAFGRTTALPAKVGAGTASMSVSYFVNDLVAGQTLGSQRQSWTLDPALRSRQFTTEALVGSTWTNAATKVNHYDGDDDEPRWIVDDVSQGAQAPVSRNVEGVDGSLAAVTGATGDVKLQLVNLHGDVAMELAADLTQLSARFFDEFGVPEGATASGSGKDRYGWLGGAQRSGEALGDVLLMGVRLYSPSLGRFLQVDPQSDGNASAYDYCNGDAVNCTDLDGNWGWKKFFSKVAKVAEYGSWIPGPIGSFSAAISSVSYAAAGNRRKALEMGLTAAAGLVGAGAGVRAGFKAAKVASKFGRRAAAGGRRAARALKSGCHSFAPDTLVVLADGSYKPIADVVAGDLVLSVDPATGESVGEPVLDVIVGSGVKHLIDLTVDDGSLLGGRVTATAIHPVWIEGKGWTTADKVTAGDLMRGSTGGLVLVRQTHDRGWLSGSTVYNLTVADSHTFYVVAGDADLLVHNASCSLAKHEAADLAHHLGYTISHGKKKGWKSHVWEHPSPGRGEPRFISRDLDGHGGGHFKGADSIKDLWQKRTRKGSYVLDLRPGRRQMMLFGLRRFRD